MNVEIIVPIVVLIVLLIFIVMIFVISQNASKPSSKNKKGVKKDKFKYNDSLSLPKNRGSRRQAPLFTPSNDQSGIKGETSAISRLIKSISEDDFSDAISYITDIHLLYKLNEYKCKTFEDTNRILDLIASTIAGQATTRANLIGGDICSDFEIYKQFIKKLSKMNHFGHFFITLGNHELWPFANQSFEYIVSTYRKILEEYGQGRLHLVQNNLFYYENNGWKEISETELERIPPEQLRQRMRVAETIIFGGIGFAGNNETFNATVGMYKDVISREQEKQESEKILNLYEKVTSALYDKNLIVLTHMPLEDWAGKDYKHKERIVYVSGHNHQNYAYDDSVTRVLANNQSGYKGKNFNLKKFWLNSDFVPFRNYDDGIHEITRNEYIKFYHGMRKYISFNTDYSKLYMLKRNDVYMFIIENDKGKLLLLDGGNRRTLTHKSLNYYYDNMLNYSISIKVYLSDYLEFQERISKEIRRIGGTGTIHGCIVDIDYYNHLFINPIDRSITPYFAYSMVDKYVYNKFPNLLKDRAPDIYRNYKELVTQQGDNSSLILYDKKHFSKRRVTHVTSTEIYRVSLIIKKLQYTTYHNVIRLWNDALLEQPSKETGRIIVSNLIEKK